MHDGIIVMRGCKTPTVSTRPKPEPGSLSISRAPRRPQAATINDDPVPAKVNARPTLARAATTFFLLALAAASAAAQQPQQSSPADDVTVQPQTALPQQAPAVVRHRTPRVVQPAVTNPNLVLLDPGHGAGDNGAAFPNGTFEKEINIALANRLRTSLTAQGFTVVMTHDNAADDVSLDSRVELVNRTHPLACVLLHASNGGHGVHLYTSSLQPRLILAPTSNDPADQPIQPWDTAQATALPQSARLLTDLNSALSGLRVPLVTGHASVKPIDSMNCAAVMVELAPLGTGNDTSGSGYTSVTDAGYQQRVSDALTQALVLWRGHWQTPAMAQAAAAQKAAPIRAVPGQRTYAPPRPATPFQPGVPQTSQPRSPAPKSTVTPAPTSAVPAARTAAPAVRPTNTQKPQPATPQTTAPAAAPAPKPQTRPATRAPIVDPDSMVVGDPEPVTRTPAPVVRKTPKSTPPQVRP